MQDVGSLLQKTREHKEIMLEQAARETNIAPRYLEALETGKYEVFPGEPYIVGFLGNYAEYLGLNSAECVKFYKNEKIQETTIPTEVLLPEKSNNTGKVLLFLMLGLLFAGGIYFFITLIVTKVEIPSRIVKDAETVETAAETVKDGTEYTLSGELFEKRLFTGDKLILPIGEKTYGLKVVKTAPELHLETANGLQIIELGQTAMLDMDADSIADMSITVEDLHKTKEKHGAAVEIRTGQFSADAKPQTNQETVVAESSANSLPSGYKVLIDAGAAYPFTLSASFRTYCLFRYEQDRTTRVEKYYQKSEQLAIQANNNIRIWASNGNAVKMQLIAGGKTVDIEVARPGKVIVKDLKWVRDDKTRRYKFIIADVD